MQGTPEQRTNRERRIAQKDPLGCVGPGTLQWNFGGYFGSQFGATLWIALLGGLLVTKDVRLGLGILGLFLVANAIGVGLWRRRATLAPHRATQLLCLTSFGAAAGTMYLLHTMGVADLAAPELGDGRPLWVYLAVYPILMAGLWWIDRAGRPKQA
ncbi:MAG: hypothetical protein P1V81_16450 [Planctomycetota bacterium]|nr:hypothetical protein [Planctomycetota bacterium]